MLTPPTATSGSNSGDCKPPPKLPLSSSTSQLTPIPQPPTQPRHHRRLRPLSQTPRQQSPQALVLLQLDALRQPVLWGPLPPPHGEQHARPGFQLLSQLPSKHQRLRAGRPPSRGPRPRRRHGRHHHVLQALGREPLGQRGDDSGRSAAAVQDGGDCADDRGDDSAVVDGFSRTLGVSKWFIISWVPKEAGIYVAGVGAPLACLEKSNYTYIPTSS